MSISEEMISLLEKEYKEMDAESLQALVELSKGSLANTIAMLSRVGIDPSVTDISKVKPGVERMLLSDYYTTVVKLAAAKRVLNAQALAR